MHIEISVPRPGLTLVLAASVAGGILWAQGWSIAVVPAGSEAGVIAARSTEDSMTSQEESLSPMPNGPWDPEQAASDGRNLAASVIDRRLSPAEENIRHGRVEQELLARKEDILRRQLKALEEERRLLGERVSEETEEQFRESTRQLMSLLQDQRKAEEFIRDSLNQLFKAQGRMMGRGSTVARSGPLRLQWPVDPLDGISAGFHDRAYEQFFGFAHDGVDIRALRGTVVTAAADGVVLDVVDNGFGFNYITIDHGRDSQGKSAVTLYGHLSPDFLVTEGQFVEAGDAIGYSDGLPGAPGAGTSTGPHLHFELRIDGVAVDPMEYLPH